MLTLLMKFQLILIVTVHQGQSLNEYLSVMNIHLVYVFTKSFKIDKAINKHFHAHFNSGLTCFLQHCNFRQGKLCMSVSWPGKLWFHLCPTLFPLNTKCNSENSD